jgi:tRNA G10  N-methylase Trm11
MKLVKVATEKKNAVQEMHSTLSTVMKRCGRAAQDVKKYQSAYDGANAVIANARELDPANTLVVSELATAEKQREMCAEKLREINESTLDRATEVMGVLQNAGFVISQACHPTHESYVKEITGALRPYFDSDSMAEQAARSTTAAHNLSWFLARTFGSHAGVAFQQAEEVLTICEKILGGELPWAFDPQPNAKRDDE